uniref:C2H2-type domain-containing protein n=1 Tax=Florenciella sp. virus SA2 TaxID=3240092 RepID=A0AB39JF92_9VIRU
MPIYHCKCCNYSTHIKTHFVKHLNTKKHKKSTQSQQKTTKESTQSQHYLPKTEIITTFNHNCKYCDKEFRTKQSMYRHIKYFCKKNNDEDLKELARLLNEKDKQINELIESNDSQLTKMQKQIEKLLNKLQIQNVNNGIITTNNVYNIQILDYNKTDYSHLTDTDFVSCIADCNYCVKSLIEKVHFNEQKPENMNIYISSIKGNYVMVYKNNTWQIQDKKEQIDDIYEYNEIVLDNWYQEYRKKYPQIIQAFKKYLRNKEENDIINEVKKEILLMLYNNRNLVLKTKDEIENIQD